jgi:hypothetical protein
MPSAPKICHSFWKFTEQDLADLRLPALHGALDLGRLEQRGVGVDRDLELAAAGACRLSSANCCRLTVWKFVAG